MKILILKSRIVRYLFNFRGLFLSIFLIFCYQFSNKITRFSKDIVGNLTADNNLEYNINSYQQESHWMNIRNININHKEAVTQQPYQHFDELNLMEDTWGLEWNKKKSKTYNSHVFSCSADYANVHQLQQDHPCVVNLIRKKYLRKPTSRNIPYQLNKTKLIDPSDGQARAILGLLRNQTNGFFIECGALDGEFLSNTLYMERSLNWTGVLIEPNRKTFSQLASRNRKSFLLPVCLSTKPYPVQVFFNASYWSGSFIVDEDTMKPSSFIKNVDSETKKIQKLEDETFYKVQCFPLYSILLAVGKTEIDFLELDVEGSEYKILKTIPWHKVDIKTLSVEWNHIPEGEAAMTHLMQSNNFVKFGHISMAYSREIVYVKDFLNDFRKYEFD